MTEESIIEINQVNSILTFLSSIDWKDPWLIVLFTFHITITMMALLTRNYGNLQVLLFFFLMYFSESINEIASENWRMFSRQQYFDSNGLFISVVFSIPILLNCMLMVGSWLWQSTQLMKTIKVAQRREKLKRQKAIENQERDKSE